MLGEQELSVSTGAAPGSGLCQQHWGHSLGLLNWGNWGENAPELGYSRAARPGCALEGRKLPDCSLRAVFAQGTPTPGGLALSGHCPVQWGQSRAP